MKGTLFEKTQRNTLTWATWRRNTRRNRSLLLGSSFLSSGFLGGGFFCNLLSDGFLGGGLSDLLGRFLGGFGGGCLFGRGLGYFFGGRFGHFLDGGLLGGSGLLRGFGLLGGLLRLGCIGELERPAGSSALGLVQLTGADSLLQGRSDVGVDRLLLHLEVSADVLLDGLSRRTLAFLESCDGSSYHFAVFGVFSGLAGFGSFFGGCLLGGLGGGSGGSSGIGHGSDVMRELKEQPHLGTVS